MADIHSCGNGGGEGESPSPTSDRGNVCPACGAAGETPAPDEFTALTGRDDEMPPPPRPLPDAVAQMAAGLLVAPERAGPAGLPVVAGYEILAPLGYGGMGLVYQARQVESGRVVALKMILGGAHARPGDLARFRAEAGAVARLAHPHIVQIYEVGEQGGWAHFALEFVPGGSLARQLAGRPQPATPSARLVEAVARAMAYAHERGVVHRDLKPANILLTADGTPKVTDFGLAKRLDLEPGTSPSRGRTRTGDVLGTPSYMAPEQTSGRPEEVGPAADVYALGAILYECLTGRPPFQAATPLDTLLQVRGEDPVPPRRLVPSVPRDLDTICLKCLQKEPRRRYPSAAALAEDLRRFLAGTPVRARPAGAWERTVRWARRRKAVAALAGVSAAAVLSLLALGAWHQIRLGGYNAELRAERDAADRLREQAQAKEAEARQQKDEAEAHFRNALAAVKQMLVRVSEEDERLANEPRMELVRRNLLEDALRFYQGFLKERPGDPEVRWETASTYLRLGDLRKRLGQQTGAEEAYGAAIALFQGLAAEFPRQPAHRHELAGCHNNLGSLLANTTRQEEAERAFHRARDIQQALAEEFPASEKYRSALAGTDHNLATLLAITRRLPEAEQALRRALEHRRRLAEEFPQEALYRRDLARTHHNLGMVLDLAGHPRKAEPAFRQALDLQRRLVEEFPRDPSYRQELAGSHNGLANVLDHTERFADAETEYAQALALQQRLADEFPRVPAHRQELAHGHYNLATLLQRVGRPRDAEQAYRRALDLLQRLVDESPGVPALLNELGRTSASLAELLLDQGGPAEARELAERAVRHQQAALKLLPRQPAYGRALGQHYRILAEALVRLGDHAAAAQAAAEMPRPSGPDERVDHFAAGVLARCIPLAEQDSTLAVEKREALARAYGDQAMALLRQGFRRGSGPGLDRLKVDPNLAPLRPRADFQKLVRDLEDAAGPGDK
jgi:eukaryotic-like serine/threonine-protein kinase